MNRYVHRFLFGAALACASLVPAVEPAGAQPPAFALGKPLPEGTMPVGTVTVRVIAGTPAEAVVDAEVTLTVNGAAQTAKSDGSGRATFRNLPVGASVQATIVDAEQKPQTSESFTIPPSGGIRVMLSTKPYTGAPASHNAGTGAPGTAGGAPEARAMSGQPRPDQLTKPGTYQVRLTYNNLTVQSGQASDPEPPIGELVTLVGYHSSNKVDVRTLPVDAKGYATFEGLDISGHTTYMALARLPRAGGVDRLTALPVQPDTQIGAKVILSGDKRTATTPPIDEVKTEQSIATPAGKVRVTLEGVPIESSITLVDATSGKKLGEAQPKKGEPDPSNVDGFAAPFQPSQDLAPGTVAITVHGGPGTMDLGLGDVAIRVIPEGDNNAEGVSGKTGSNGTLQLTVPTGKPQRAVINVNGKDLVSNPFDATKAGGRLDVTVHWEAEGRPQALFDVEYKPELVLYAETTAKLPGAAAPQLFRSRPIQLVEGTGVHLPITVYPRILVNFSKRALVEDEKLGVRGTYTIQNMSWAPFSAGPDGMVLPLPKGFKGGQIAEENQGIASIAPGEGVRLVRPLAPGRTQFIVGYTLFSEGGELEWSLDLPYDMFQSGMEIKLHDGMTVRPQGARGRVATARDGSEWFVLDEISIRAGSSMVMKISGMPSQPAWRLWLPRIVGVLVVVLMIGGVVLALLKKPVQAAGASAAERRRSALLDELVELERTGKDPARREKVLAELERTWQE